MTSLARRRPPPCNARFSPVTEVLRDPPARGQPITDAQLLTAWRHVSDAALKRAAYTPNIGDGQAAEVRRRVIALREIDHTTEIAF
jgi:hypothetical protein